jgi:hypothetical protein
VAGPSTIHGRRQRRRALIAWGTAAIVVALIALGAIFGGAEDEGRAGGHPDVFGHAMTVEQYDSLEKGLDESDFVDRLQQTGLPENQTDSRFVLLFPPHGDDVLCSFWEISDRPGYVARVCFSDPEAKLVQKLQRSGSDGDFGVRV